MKKPLMLVSVIALCIGLLAGCGTPDVATNTIIVDKDGKVTEAIVESFDQEYYSEEELKAFVEEEIEAYIVDHSKGDVKMSGLSVDAGTAKMVMRYVDATTYRDFHKVNFYVGTVVNAQSAGYDFNAKFFAVKDGVADTTYAGTSTVVAEEGNVLVIQEYIDVQVPGTITYVSEGVQVNSNNSVSIVAENEGDVAPLAYIIYK